MDQSSDENEIEQLERLSKLHSDGALTDEEFVGLKATLFASRHERANRAGAGVNSNPAERHASPVPDHGGAGTRLDQDITLAVVVGWAWSVFFAVLGATMLLTGHAAASVCALISALIVFPPLDSFVISRWAVSLPAALRFLFAFVLLVAMGRLLGLTLESFTIPAAPASGSPPTSEQNLSPTGDQSVSSVGEGASSNDGPTAEQNSQSNPNKQPDSTPVKPSAGATENVPEGGIGDSIMQPRFGNTVISRSDTTEWHLYFNSDHTFTGREIRTNYRVAGTWRIVDTNLCMAFQPPLAGTSDPNCKPISAHQLGDNWTVDQSLFTLVEGIQ